MFTTYILFSKTLNKFYIGFSGEAIQTRLSKHLRNHQGFTGKAKDWELVYQELFHTKQEAMLREKQIKGWKSNIRIKELIARRSIE